jgi:hypothetical protein
MRHRQFIFGAVVLFLQNKLQGVVRIFLCLKRHFIMSHIVSVSVQFAIKFVGPGFIRCARIVSSLRPFIRPSVRKYQHGSHWRDFREIWYWKLLDKSVQKPQIYLKSGKQYRALYAKNEVGFIVAGFINWPQSIVVKHSIFLYSWLWRVAQQYSDNDALCFHCNNGHANAPKCYVIRLRDRLSC